MIGIPFSSTRQPSIISGSASGPWGVFLLIGNFPFVDVGPFPGAAFHESEAGARITRRKPAMRAHGKKAAGTSEAPAQPRRGEATAAAASKTNKAQARGYDIPAPAPSRQGSHT